MIPSLLLAAALAFCVGYVIGGLRMYELGAADNAKIERQRRDDRLRALLQDLTDDSPPLPVAPRVEVSE